MPDLTNQPHVGDLYWDESGEQLYAHDGRAWVLQEISDVQREVMRVFAKVARILDVRMVR